MPTVTGQPEDDARQALEDMGLSVEVFDETEPCTEPPGFVCRQDPEGGTPVSEGDTATIYVQPEGGPPEDD
jgi:beta-lactam-binding protein with PASTA domain